MEQVTINEGIFFMEIEIRVQEGEIMTTGL